MMAAIFSASPATDRGRMMVRTLLIRGMMVGCVAGLLAFGFGKLVGEPQVDRAIAFESRMGEAKNSTPQAHTPMQAHVHGPGMAMQHEAGGTELVSRTVQGGIGLFTGVLVYCTAFGGLFALVFAYANGRAADLGPRALSALLAGAGFVAVYLVPSLKYPASPPAVGEPDTIGYRTALYFILMAISITAMVGTAILRKRLVMRHGAWSAALMAAAAYLIVVIAAQLLLPDVNEVPDAFPAVLLWQFRLAALGMQAILWATIGLLFGALTERAADRRIVFGASRMTATGKGM